MKTIENFNFLNVTNLTNTPILDLTNALDEAIRWVEVENKKIINEHKKNEIVDAFNEYLRDFENNGKMKDLRTFVDNTLVNFDFVEFVINSI